MKCSECGELIDLSKSVKLPITKVHEGRDYDYAYPCSVCGRLHWSDNKPVSNPQTKKKAYWLNGEVVAKPL